MFKLNREIEMSGPIWSMAVAKNGYLACGLEKGGCCLVDMRQPTNQPNISFLDESNTRSVCFSPDSQYLCRARNDIVVKYDVSTRRVSAITNTHNNTIWSVCYSPDGRYIASGSDDRTPKICDANTSKHVISHSKHTRGLWMICYSPCGKFLVSASEDKTIIVWNLEKDTTNVLTGHTGDVRSLCYSPNGKFLVSGSGDSTIRVWLTSEVHNGGNNCLLVLEGHTSNVRSICFTPDSKLLCSSSDDGTIKVWDFSEKIGLVDSFVAHKKYVRIRSQ